MISLIPDIFERELFRDITHEMKVEDIGTGIAFTVPLTSSSKYVKETFSKREGKAMKNKRDYQLIVTVVNTGHADKVMVAAKKAGLKNQFVLNPKITIHSSRNILNAGFICIKRRNFILKTMS